MLALYRKHRVQLAHIALVVLPSLLALQGISALSSRFCSSAVGTHSPNSSLVIRYYSLGGAGSCTQCPAGSYCPNLNSNPITCTYAYVSPHLVHCLLVAQVLNPSTDIIARTLAPRHKRRVRLATTALVAPPSLPAPTGIIQFVDIM
jgi:hypothetical protein